MHQTREEEQTETPEVQRGFAGTNNAWARMNATAHATGDHLRAWISTFTGSTSSSTTATDTDVSWTI